MDLTSILVAGHGPEHITGMDPAFRDALTAMILAAPPEIQNELRILSGYRSVDRQEELWNAALAKYGSPEAADNWVAPPGRSQHNHGRAADLRFLGDAARQYVHENASNYGLAFPMSHEPWHIELADARSGGMGMAGPTRAAAAGMDPSNPLNAAPAGQPLPLMPPAAAAEPQNPMVAALSSLAQSIAPSGMATAQDAPMLAQSTGPLAAGMAADQRHAQLSQLKDFLMPLPDDVSTSVDPMKIAGNAGALFGEPSAPGPFAQMQRPRPKPNAPLGPGMRLRA